MEGLVRLPAAPYQTRSAPPPVYAFMVRTVYTCGLPQPSCPATQDQRGSAPCQDRPLVGEREAGVRFRLAADLPGAGGGVLARTAVMRLVAPFRRCSARAYHRRWPAHAASEG